MGVRFPSVFSTAFVGPFPANSSEFVCLVSPPFTPPLDFSAIVIMWATNWQPGTACTNEVWQLRRGTTTAGTPLQVRGWESQVVAAQPATTSGCYVDTPGAVSGIQYALTLQQVAATGAGTNFDGCIWVYAL